jgi:hypothetical protein
MRKTHGQIISRWYGLPALLLATTGAKSGQRRVQPLVYVRDGRDFAIVGTNFGQTHHPAWTANLLAHPAGQRELTVPRPVDLMDGHGVPLGVAVIGQNPSDGRHCECRALVQCIPVGGGTRRVAHR